MTITAGMFLGWPIAHLDNDIWFHLHNGRYLFTHHAIPHDTYFSFITPRRVWVNYSWGFQALVYSLYSWWGYGGLIALRAAVYLAVVSMIIRFLLQGQEDRPWRPWFCGIAVLYGLCLISRHLLIRPHIFSYLFIVLSLYLIEYRPRRMAWLPLIGLLWGNMHGLTYPVLILINVSYIAEYLLRRLIGSLPTGAGARAYLTPLMLSTLTIYLKPRSRDLIASGFPSSQGLYRNVQEFAPLRMSDVLSFHMIEMIPSTMTMFNLLIVAAVFAIMTSLVRRRGRVSHLLLCIGGAFLLTKGVRFLYEGILLALPVIKANLPHMIAAPDERRTVPKPVSLAFVGFLMVMPFAYLHATFSHRPKYPFSPHGLPEGIATFLRRVDTGGTILNYPDNGGYLRWKLHPRYTIFMDMESIFTDEDFYLAQHAFQEEVVLRNVLARYDPSFITAPISFGDFRKVMEKVPEYVLVFCDDAEVLYVNQRHHPALAHQYALNALEPYLTAHTLESVSGLLQKDQDPEALLREVHRLLSIYPDGILTNVLATLTYDQEGAYDRALPYAEIIQRNFPEFAVGYRLNADALVGLKLFDRAIPIYRMAWAQAEPSERPQIAKAMSVAYRAQGQPGKAYDILRRSFDPLSSRTTPEELYLLGSSALLAGKVKEAKALLVFLDEYKTLPNERRWVERLEHELTKVGGIPLKR